MINDTHYSIRYYDDDVEDTTTHSNQPTARMLTWKDKRVSSPGENLQVDDDQSLQTNAEQWDQSEAKEINSIIPQGAITPIHNGPMQIELNKRSRHPAISTNASMGFATITTKLISSQSNCRRHYTNKRVATSRLLRAPAIEVSLKSTTYATYPDRD
jgi:hypothetical protein